MPVKNPREVKFSVLLPTRNRLQYLKYAIETVRRQDYDSWELVISDNYSEEDIATYVETLGDARIKYYRTDSFVSVTENWNNALERSTGEYVVMLGDDDCLMRGYFSTLCQLIEQYERPDFVYTNAFQYAYPGVMPEYPEGYLLPAGWAVFLRTATEPFLLGRKEAVELVKDSMNLKVTFAFNTQNTLISRRFIDSLKDKGKFYQSAFPDYYATNVMFLKAERILICPLPLVVTGICPKSYGFYYFNQRETEGVEFLQNTNNAETRHSLTDILLPGEYISTGFLLAMEKVKEKYGAEFNLRVNYRRYRSMQIFHAYEKHHIQNLLSKEDFLNLKACMSIWERWLYGVGIFGVFTIKHKLSGRLRTLFDRLLGLMVGRTLDNYLATRLGRDPAWDAKRIIGHHNILEVFENIDPMAAVGK